MSFPFESRSHAQLRRRLLAAMGLLPACVSDPSLIDASEPDDETDSAAAAPDVMDEPPPHASLDAGPSDSASGPTFDAGSLTLDAGSLMLDAGSVMLDASSLLGPLLSREGGIFACQSSDRRDTQCFTHAQLLDAAKGISFVSPKPPPRSEEELEALIAANGCLPPEYVHDGCCNPAMGAATIGADDTCCYEFCAAACCGRPFVVEGKARLARAMRRSDWLAILPELGGKSLPMPLRERAAAEWLEDARMEHASVAAFARFTLELLAFAAPSDLVMESQLAGLDEVEHARLCFGLASRYAGAQLGPSMLTMANVAPAASLRESVLSAVLEGCIGETLAAARASAALEGTREQAARTVLAKIAEDESRHAELAYRYVAWALTREPSLASDIHELVRRESSLLSAKSQGQADTMRVDVLEPALTLLGRLSAPRARETHDATFAQVILPCITNLLASHHDAMQDGKMRGLRSGDVA